MSRINSLRIINLNYNNGTMKIDDETFDLGGQSTLMSLRNGGGKSVMVQMMIAPFVSKRYRNMKDREFNSYFTTNSPTYILTEWLLDDEKTNVLIGMMIKRKTTTNDEDDEEEIDILNFVHEYEGDSKYSIRNIPIVERHDKGRSIKSFLNSKNLFEKLKKDSEINFNYYNMNTSSQARNYFENIKQYKVNHKEWESIIKEINKKESGLSDLFNDSKTVAGLVEKWFIKAVEDKLNETKDKVKNFQDISKKYIYQYKENTHKLNKKESIEKFKLMTQEILYKANEFKDSKNNTQEIENKISNLIKYLNDLLEIENFKIENLEKEIENINDYIKDLEYEKLCIEILKSEDEYKHVLEQENKIQSDIKNLDEDINKLNYEKNVIDCAYKYETYQASSKEVQRIENEIAIVNKKDKSSKSERENLGYNLKNYYINKENKLKEELRINIEDENNSKNLLNTLENNKDEGNKKLNNNIKNKGSIETSIKSFNEEEKKFNSRYKKSLQRNIVGYYEENFINKNKLEYEDKLKNLEKSTESYKIEKIKTQEIINRSKRQEQELVLNIYKLDEEKSKLEKELTDKNENLSKRKDILKYIDSNESYIFDDKHILKSLNKKLEVLNEENKNLNIKYDNISNEIKKLVSGKTVEIPKELENKLSQRDIHIVYGMQWLKENNYSEKENLELVKTNPLIPYSIVIGRADIEKLKKESLEIFTSYPIPIIERESLKEVIGQSENEVFIINNTVFLLSFNDKLLNEKELKEIINNLENKKLIIGEKIENKKSELDKYSSLIYFINENKLSKIEYDKTIKNIEINKLNIKEENENLNITKENINKSIEKLENIELTISIKSDNIKDLKIEILDFNDLIDKYKQYEENKEYLSKIEEEITKIRNYIENQNNEIKATSEIIDKLKDNRRTLQNDIDKTVSNVLKYKNYTQGVLIQKDIEDIEALFDSLTKEISLTLQELERNLKVNSDRQRRDEEQLIQAQKTYGLVDKDFKNVIYNNDKVSIIQQNIRELEKNKVLKTNEDKQISNTKGKLENKIEELYKNLNKRFEKEEVKAKEYLVEKEFDKLIFIEKDRLNNLHKNKKIYENNINIIDSNLSNLSEFSKLEIITKYNISVDISELKDYVGSIKRDYNASKGDEYKLENELNIIIDKISREKEFINDDFFKKSLDILIKVSVNPSEVISNLEQTLTAHKVTLEKLNADIDIIHKEKERVVEMLYDYINEVHINIGKIDRNSTIKIKEKDVKMLNIKTSDWEENKDLYKLKTKNLLESLTNSCLETLSKNENIEETISKTITTKNLYNEVVSIGSIDVKLYKIEENRQRMISWEQVCQNSGGEGFLSAFVVLNSLLSFMRKSDSDIFKTYEDSKVIIMDNPFAQTNAEHLLKPLMDIAKKSNTQLIAFSGLKGESIYNRFDNIYVLDLMTSKMKNNLSFLRGNHHKGEETVQEIISSRFEIKDEIIDQMTLF